MNPARAAREAARSDEATQWTPPVLRAAAAKGEGVAELAAALERHARYLGESGTLRERRRGRLRDRVLEVVELRVRQRLWQDPPTNAWLDGRLAELEAGTATPFAVADELLSRSTALLSSPPAT